MAGLSAYKATLAAVSAVYPGGVLVPVDLRDYDENAGAAYDRVDTAAAVSADGQMVLSLVPLKQFGMSITVNGSARTKVRIGEEGAGKVGVDFLTGKLSFHSSDWAAVNPSVTYRGRGSALWAMTLNQLQKEMAAIETAAAGFVTGPASVDGDTLAVFSGPTGKVLKGSLVFFNSTSRAMSGIRKLAISSTASGNGYGLSVDLEDTSSPYAIYTKNANTGAGNGSTCRGIVAEASVANASAIVCGLHGEVLSGSSGKKTGVVGRAQGTNAIGVHGVHGTAALAVGDDTHEGVRGESSEAGDGIGVRGHASGSTGNNAGVHGTAVSPDGVGVSGAASATGSGDGASGVLGTSGAGAGAGVRGRGTGANGTPGLHGSSVSGAAVFGRHDGDANTEPVFLAQQRNASVANLFEGRANGGGVVYSVDAAGNLMATSVAAAATQWQWRTVNPAPFIPLGWGSPTAALDGAETGVDAGVQPVYFPPMSPGTKIRKVRVVIAGDDTSGSDGINFQLFAKLSAHGGAPGWTAVHAEQSARITDASTRAAEYTLGTPRTVLSGEDYMLLATSVLASGTVVQFYAASLEINPAL